MKNVAPLSPADCTSAAVVPSEETVDLEEANGTVPSYEFEEVTNEVLNIQEESSALREKEPEPPPQNFEHFQKMRPTSWSPPPTKHKNINQNRISDPGSINFNSGKSGSRIGISSSKSDNVFKITVSPLQSPLVHRLQIGSSDSTSSRGGRRTSIMINGDQSNLSSETSSDNKVTISVGGEDSVCNPTVISVNSDISPKIQSSSENRTLVILDNYSSNIIVEPSNDEKRTSRSYSEASEDSLEGTLTPTIEKRTGLFEPDVQLRKIEPMTKEEIVSKLLEDSLKKARRNGEILDESSGEAILKILKQTLLKSGDYESSESTVEPEPNYSRSSSLNSEVDFVAGNIYLEENPYEVIKEPIYEEIPDEPPPLPLSPPPSEAYKDQAYFADDYNFKKFNSPSQMQLRSYFPDEFFKKPTSEELGTKKTSNSDENYAAKFELLNYLMDSKDRNSLIEEEDAEGELEALYEQKETSLDDLSSKSSQISNVSDSSEESNIALTTSSSPETLKVIPYHDSNSLSSLSDSMLMIDYYLQIRTVDIERTDSGVGSESSQASSSRGAITRRWRGSSGLSSGPGSLVNGMPQVSGDVKLCQDCEQRLDPMVTIR